MNKTRVILVIVVAILLALLASAGVYRYLSEKGRVAEGPVSERFLRGPQVRRWTRGEARLPARGANRRVEARSHRQGGRASLLHRFRRETGVHHSGEPGLRVGGCNRPAHQRG